MNNVLKFLPHGTFLKNSSKPIEGFKYDHPLDGHGYINAFRITPNSITYKGFRQRTTHYVKEFEANRALYRGLGTNTGNRFLVNNFNNVSVFVDEAGNTFSCGEGGVPYQIDVDEDKTIGPVPLFDLPSFVSTNMPFLPISAHPLNDDGHVYNFGCFNRGLYILEDNRVIHTEFFGGSFYAHDFKLTPRHFVFFLNSMRINLYDAYFGKRTILDSMEFLSGSTILVIDRRTFDSKQIRVGDDGERLYALHIPSVKEVSPEQFKVHACLSSEIDLQGARSAHDFIGFHFHEILVDVARGTSQVNKLMDVDAEMPVISGDCIYLIDENTLYKYDTVKGTCAKKMFGENVIIEEPCVVDDVVMVIGHHHAEPAETRLYFLYKNDLKTIHVQTFPFEIPYGFHGVFSPFTPEI